MQEHSKKILVGKINGFYSFNGWVKIFSYTNPKENILSYQPWWYFLDNKEQKIQIVSGRKQGKTIIAQIKDIDSKDKAQKFLDVDLYVDKEVLPKLQNEVYWHELEGMQVVNLDGIELGIVANMFSTSANDVIVIEGDKELLIPYIKPFLVSVDREKRIIIVDWDKDF